MSMYEQIVNAWKRRDEIPELKKVWRERLLKWRGEPATLRLERPTRLDRARALGYVPKPGVFVVRQRVGAGPHKRPDWSGGRKSKNMRRTKILQKNYRAIAEERAARMFKNCEVINSYFVAKDGHDYWFEVILVDRTSPAVLSDKRLSWLANPANRGRAFRGLTSAGKVYRGLRWKGKGSEKARPSRRANASRKLKENNKQRVKEK
ncbi:MAG: 50S ribosomal protein L15e [Candidatus Woesearchaeota archaeon]